jgi:hypothetical protein
MNAIARRETVEEIVERRNKAIELYGVAHSAILQAQEAVRAANEVAWSASPGTNSFNHQHADEVKAFFNAVAPPPRDQYLTVAKRLIDINVWSWLIERTDLERLMDKEAKDQLRKQMAYVPMKPNKRGQLITEEEQAQGMPEVTVDNIIATLEHFRSQQGLIFRRGIANVFSALDRRFKSHDGFKIGSRIILTYAFDDYGHLNWGRIEDMIVDVERVFAVLDGKPESGFTSAVRQLRHQRSGFGGKRQTELETEYFLIRGFKNGNAHIWFRRDDLVQKVNKLLGEYYGEVIGDGQQAEEDPLSEGNRKTTPARYFGFFPTPEDAAERVIGKVSVMQKRDKGPIRILEPSAGTGNLARRLVRGEETAGNDWMRRQLAEYTYATVVDCVEIQPHLAAGLEVEGIYRKVYVQDFLTLSPQVTGLYNRVVMNPPFDRERDIDHIMHALDFLEEDGQLVAILSAGTEFRETKKAVAFRALMESKGADWTDLPAGSFASVGTYVNTVILNVHKNGKKSRW